MNHITSTTGTSFVTSSGIEFISSKVDSKRAIEQPVNSSAKRTRKSKNDEVNKLAAKITSLIKEVESPNVKAHEVKDKQHQIASLKLQELRIVHKRLKAAANHLYNQKNQLVAEVTELTQKLVSKEAEISLSPDANVQEKMDQMKTELTIAQFDSLMAKEALHDEQKKWEATVAQMRAQHAKELKEKEDALAVEKAVAGLQNGSSKTMKARLAVLVKKNKELNEELTTLRAENGELTESANHSQAELLVTQKATQRLLAQKQEAESQYQSLLKELTCMVERRK